MKKVKLAGGQKLIIDFRGMEFEVARTKRPARFARQAVLNDEAPKLTRNLRNLFTVLLG